MLAGLLQCWSIALIIASWSVANFEIPFPGPKPNASSDVVIQDFTCNGFTMPETLVALNDSMFAIDMYSKEMSMKCMGNWGKEKDGEMTWLGQVWLVVNVAGKLNGYLERNDSSNACLATNYSLPKNECTLTATIVEADCNCSGDPWDCAWNDCKSELHSWKSIWDDWIAPLICPLVGDLIGGSLTNRNPLNFTVLPPPRPDAPPLDDNPFIRMANKIVNVLPSLGGIKLALSLIGQNGANFGLDVEKHWNIQNSTTWRNILNFTSIDLVDLQLPKGIKVDLDIIIDYFVCQLKSGNCSLSGLGIYNARVTGFQDEDLGLDQLVNTLLLLLDDFLLKPTASNETDANNTMNFTLIPGKEMRGPPLFVYGLIGIVPAFFFVSLSLFSIRYHLRRKHTVEKQEEIRRSLISTQDLTNNVRVILSYSPWRGILRDVVILLLCNSALMMFVYANAETAVTVSLANEINIFAFSLQNSVQDFWKSGLKALAFFIALFSGAYPYFKLIVIVMASVVHRDTKSRFLRVIDSIGRYSFLDSFVMMVLVTTLQVPNIAIVEAHPPFYSFIIATVVSMIAGNVATHTYDPGLIVTIIDAEGENSGLTTSKRNFFPSEPEEEKEYGRKYTPALVDDEDEDEDDNNRQNIYGGVNASTKKSTTAAPHKPTPPFIHSNNSSPPQTIPQRNDTNNSSTEGYGSTENITPASGITSPTTCSENNNGQNNIAEDVRIQRQNTSSTIKHKYHAHHHSPSSGAVSDDLDNNNKNDSSLDSSQNPENQKPSSRPTNSSYLMDADLIKKYRPSSASSSPASPRTPALMRDFVDFPLLEKPWCHKSTIYLCLLFCGSMVWAPLIYNWIAPALRYEFSGFVTVLKGTHQDYSLHRLFFESPPALGAIATITIVIAPMIISIYPHEKVLGYVGPWCSTDVFLLTCLAALLQLHAFIAAEAGPILGLMINANAELRAPFYVLIVSVVFQQYYIIRAAIGKNPQTHRSSDGSPADNDRPPWLFASLTDMMDR